MELHSEILKFLGNRVDAKRVIHGEFYLSIPKKYVDVCVTEKGYPVPALRLELPVSIIEVQPDHYGELRVCLESRLVFDWNQNAHHWVELDNEKFYFTEPNRWDFYMQYSQYGIELNEYLGDNYLFRANKHEVLDDSRGITSASVAPLIPTVRGILEDKEPYKPLDIALKETIKKFDIDGREFELVPAPEILEGEWYNRGGYSIYESIEYSALGGYKAWGEIEGAIKGKLADDGMVYRLKYKKKDGEWVYISGGSIGGKLRTKSLLLFNAVNSRTSYREYTNMYRRFDRRIFRTRLPNTGIGALTAYDTKTTWMYFPQGVGK